MDIAIDSVIDAIETNHLKTSLSLCEKYLKKWPGNLQFLGLKSLALWYSGNEHLSAKLAIEIAEKKPKDHFTISIIERVLEFMDNYEAIASLCENSLKFDYDIRIAEKLYLTHLKLQDTKKLYSIASKMFNSTKSQLYLYWAIVGLILEFKNGDGKDNTVLIELAKRILDKTSVPPSESKLMLDFKHLNILVYELAGDHQGILNSLELETKINPSDYNQMKIISNSILKNFEAAKSLCISEIENSSCLDSAIWNSLLDVLKNVDNGDSIAKRMILSIDPGKDLRGFKCAMLELKLAYPSVYNESASEMLFEFSVSLNHKPSILNDVIFFLKKFQKEEICSYNSKITNYINSSSNSDDLTDRALFLHLLRYLNLTSGTECLICEGAQNYLRDLYSKIDSSKNINDRFYSLALYRSLCLIDDLSLDNKQYSSNLIDIIGNYSSLFSDKYVFGMLQIIISLNYGLFKRAHMNFKSLEIKCLQLDTLGYLIFDHALNLFAITECESLCVESACLYDSNRRDTYGLLCQSIESQSFVSVIDFYDFYNRLERSIQHVSVETTHIKLNIMNMPVNDLISHFASDRIKKSLKVLSYSFGNIIDNRDYNIFDTIDPSGNLKKILDSLNSFKVEDALFYYYFVNFINSCSQQEKYAGVGLDFNAVKDSYYCKMMYLMSNSESEYELTTSAKSIFDEIVEQTINIFGSLSIVSCKYEHMSTISNYAMKSKQIYIVVVLKLLSLKIKNISSSSLIRHIKSECASMKLRFKQAMESVNNIDEDYAISVQNVIAWFDDFTTGEV